MTVTGYYWDFGDGNSSTDSNPEHVYQNGGVYLVTLTVTTREADGDCCKKVYKMKVEIKECPPCEFLNAVLGVSRTNYGALIKYQPNIPHQPQYNY